MFPKIVVHQWYTQIIHFDRVFHCKPSIFGYPYFWKHPYKVLATIFRSLSKITEFTAIKTNGGLKKWQEEVEKSNQPNRDGKKYGCLSKWSDGDEFGC